MTRPDREGPYSFRPVTRADLPTLARWLEASHVGAWWDEPGHEGPAGAIIGTVEGVATEPIEGRLRVIVDPRPPNHRAIRACDKAGFRTFGRRNTVFGRHL